MDPRRAVALAVVDGDTFDFLLDLGWRTYIYGRLRLRSADTPELSGKDASPMGPVAKARAMELLLDRYALVRADEDKKSFDRFIADVWVEAPAPRGVRTIVVPQGQRWCSLAELLVAEGQAVVMTGS